MGEELGWQNTSLHLESYCCSHNCWSWLSGCCLVLVNARNCAGGKQVLGWDRAVWTQHSSQHTSDAASAKWWNKLPFFPSKTFVIHTSWSCFYPSLFNSNKGCAENMQGMEMESWALCLLLRVGGGREAWKRGKQLCLCLFWYWRALPSDPRRGWGENQMLLGSSYHC